MYQPERSVLLLHRQKRNDIPNMIDTCGIAYSVSRVTCQRSHDLDKEYLCINAIDGIICLSPARKTTAGAQLSADGAWHLVDTPRMHTGV